MKELKAAPPPPSKKRFRFQKGKERIANLQSELHLHTKIQSYSNFLLANESTEPFHEELILLGELYTNECFQRCYRQLRRITNSTAQLLHHLPQVIVILNEQVENFPKDADVMIPVLKLYVALAKDLQKEFYPHFASCLPMILSIIDKINPELTTEVFKSLSMLFKHLQNNILADMHVIHKYYGVLLGHSKEFVREFAANVFSVLLRKVKSGKDFQTYVSSYLSALVRGSGSDEVLDGTAKLFFAIMKNVQAQFHSRTTELLKILLSGFAPQKDTTPEQNAAVYDIARRTIQLIRKYTSSEYATPIWTSLDTALTTALNQAQATSFDAESSLYLARQCNLLALFTSFKRGDLVGDSKALLTTVKTLLDTALSSSSLELREALLNLACQGALALEGEFFKVVGSIYTSNALPQDANIDEFSKKIISLLPPAAISQHVLPKAVQYAFKQIKTPTAFLHSLGIFITWIESNQDMDTNIVLSYQDGQLVLDLSKVDKSFPKVFEDVGTSVFKLFVETNDTTLLLEHCASARQVLRCLQFCKVLKPKEMTKWMKKFSTQLNDIHTTADASVAVVTVRAQCLQVLGKLNRLQKIRMTEDELLALLPSQLTTSTAMLRAVQSYMQKPIDDALNIQTWYNMLHNNLRSPSQELRIETLRLFAHSTPLTYQAVEDGSLDGPCDALQHCLQLESAASTPSVDTEREIIRVLDRFKALCRSAQTPRLYVQIIVGQMLGLFHVKLSTIWSHISAVIHASVELYFESIWGILCEELQFVSTRSALIVPTIYNQVHSSPLVAALTTDCLMELGQHSNASTTDLTTHHNLVWKTLELFPNLVEQKSKIVIPIFCCFLRDQYYAVYPDEVDRVGEETLTLLIASAEESRKDNPKYAQSHLLSEQRFVGKQSGKTVQSKLLSFLGLFKRFTNYPGVYGQSILWDFFYSLLLKTEDRISRVALECLYAFKPAYLLPYRTQLNELTEAKTFRETLTNFKVDRESGVLMVEHRAQFFPVLLRILYAKFISRKGTRSAKHSLAHRRTTVLAFLVALDAEELVFFIDLMCRPFQLKTIGKQSFQTQLGHAQRIISQVSPSKQVGFLNVLEEVIAQLGMKVTAYVPDLLAILTAILGHDDVGQMQKPVVAEEIVEEIEKETNADEEEEEEEETDRNADQLRRQTRMLTFRRLGQLVEQFDGVFDFAESFKCLFQLSHTSIMHLPNVVRGARKPPALLEWMRTIATSGTVVSVLSAEIINSVILCLSSGAQDNGISHEILDCLLSFMDGLLTSDEAGLTNVFLQHVPFVLDQFIARFEFKTAKFIDTKNIGSSKKEVQFLCRLTPHITNVQSSSANQLMVLLLPFLTKNHKTSPLEKEQIFDVITELIPRIERPHVHVNFLSKLIAPGVNCITDLIPRQKMMHVFTAIGNHPNASDIKPMCDYIADLNAIDPRRLEEIDFERRISAFQELNVSKFAAFIGDSTTLVPLVSQYLFSMHDKEYSLRNAARTGLESLITIASTDPKVLHIFETVLMPSIRQSLKSPEEDIRRGFLLLLAVVADKFGNHETVSFHGDLVVLRNLEDVEVDFFYNMTHIQSHRRLRAIQRLGNGLEQKKIVLSNSTIHNVIVPLLQNTIYEAKVHEGIGSEAAQCLGSASALLSWSNYYTLVRNLLKQIPTRPESETLIIAAVCSILDNFHFEGIVVTDGWKASREERAAVPVINASSIQKTMIETLLPMLKSFLTKGDRKIGKTKSGKDQSTTAGDYMLRVPVALAIVKLLRRLPAHVFYQELPKLLIQVTKLLRSKDEAVRTSSRMTLVKIAVELGPTYLLAIVSELENSLQMGYMAHVLSFTLFSILEKVAEACEQHTPPPLTSGASTESAEAYSSPLDDCVPKIVTILVRDIFGDIGQERSEKKKSKTKEAKACRSFDSFELLARCINFLPNPTIHTLLLPVVQSLEDRNANAKTLLHVRNVFQRVALGLSKNKSVEKTHMFLYIYNMLSMCFNRITYLQPDQDKPAIHNEEGLSSWLVLDWADKNTKTIKEQKRVSAWETFRIEARVKMTGFDRYNASKSQAANTSADEILQYTVSLLFTILRKGTTDFALLDPFVPLILRCLAEIKHTETVITSLKCIAIMLNHPLPTLIESLSSLVNRIFKIIQRAGAATKNEMTQSCYRALSVLIRERHEYTMEQSQLRGILSFLRHDIEEMDHQNATFNLLKAVLARRLVVVEVYDLMIRVGEMMVQNQVANVRTNCASMYLLFLLDYPLGEKRLNYHFRFLVNNLTFVYESGRMSSLECLHALVKKLPSDLLDARAQFFFLPLVLQLVNDEAAPCRQLAAKVITDLFKRMSLKIFTACLTIMEPWWASPDPKLSCAVAHVSSLVVAARPDLVKKNASYLKTLETQLSSSLNNALAVMGEQDEDDILQVTWEPVYYSLLCVDTISTSLSEQFEAWSTILLDTIIGLLTYPHTWVRLAAVKFVRGYFKRRTPAILDSYLTQPGKLFIIARQLCKQLESIHLTEELIEQTIASLLFVLRSLRSFPDIDQMIEQREQVDETDETDEIDDEEPKEKQQSSPVTWLFTRLSFLARGHQLALRKTAVYKFYAGAIVQEEDSFLVSVLLQMISPLYRDSNNEKYDEDVPNSIRNFAREVLQLLEAKIDPQVFLGVYSHVQKKITESRELRKQKRKIEAVVEPELAAKRKMLKHVRKRESKQLKKRKFGILKGSMNKMQKIEASIERQRKARPGHY